MAHNFTNNIFDPVTHQLLFTKCTYCDGRGDDHAVRTAPCPNPPTGATGSSTDDLVERITTIVRPVLCAVNALCSAKPVSTVSDRDRHHEDFKEGLKERYQCKNPGNVHVTKCMILGQFLSTNKVKASHIVGLHERNICSTLGFDDVWDERNGILLYDEIDKRFESMELTFLSDPSDHTIRLKVLFDNILDKELALNRETIGLYGPGKVTFRDLHDRPLLFPPLKFPFRRALARHAKSAYDIALRSTAPHTIASSSVLSEDGWEALWDYCKELSPECSDTAYFND